MCSSQPLKEVLVLPTKRFEREMVKNDNTTSQPNIQLHSLSSNALSMMPKRVSLIDTTLAQYCSLKRTRESTDGCAMIKSVSDGTIHAVKRAKIAEEKNVPVLTIMPTSNAETDENMCPYTFIQSMIDESASQNVPLTTKPLHESEFLVFTEDQINAYNGQVVNAVRMSDVQTLRELYENGQDLRCCNRFGESLLHIACRRSNAEVISFLLKEAKVSPRIKDDYGRTPLHDACWRGSPEYEIVELLLEIEPRLAFVKDVRGHKPFQYARREHWGGWRDFLQRKKDLILTEEP